MEGEWDVFADEVLITCDEPQVYSAAEGVNLISKRQEILAREREREFSMYATKDMGGVEKAPIYNFPSVYCEDTKQYLCTWCNANALGQDSKKYTRISIPLIPSSDMRYSGCARQVAPALPLSLSLSSFLTLLFFTPTPPHPLCIHLFLPLPSSMILLSLSLMLSPSLASPHPPCQIPPTPTASLGQTVRFRFQESLMRVFDPEAAWQVC